ncbi:hypothetical protein XMM379_002369 [Aliiroseovarius sp. xm-m-379]|nr:hypothetical protein [Aliiroseovarius sp. xm-d-517]NRP25670.1 hypothetical protein [Aliiroseovarius sp. xm-m-379]NRP31176.1 hypothetical protein [Aliiroseovarius sp. xm-m-314]NRP34469.1 hypothetical protein [Aliiroseovarius sp. xm-a-104]NRP41904.1 hypothetical protein [Aliiroseovarius sp. xm-m-339-2]NRP45164.1 hypothetical protein [Aliiroseovarius sp. xm-m-378]NRP50932.1 hypothetical protein [Aliiroseovarius sp. xm-m-354]NRP62910.1 hypothetical protein [Aliiroseovarius sp. xm-a-151]NRP66
MIFTILRKQTGTSGWAAEPEVNKKPGKSKENERFLKQ